MIQQDIYQSRVTFIIIQKYIPAAVILTVGTRQHGAVVAALPLLFAKNTFIIHQKWGTSVIKTNRVREPTALPPGR